MHVLEQFVTPTLPPGFHWFNEPARFKVGHGLEIHTDAGRDFWQNTHYGFQHDDGHCLLTDVEGDFEITTHVAFQPKQRYDQCGLIVRIDAKNWLKASTEYENDEISRLGSVVTNLGYSDWATQDIPSVHREMWYRISKRGSDFLVEGAFAGEGAFDGQQWFQMRIAHLHALPAQLAAGVYACSPLGQDFACTFSMLSITDNHWTHSEG